jgi:hypothetical protein
MRSLARGSVRTAVGDGSPALATNRCFAHVAIPIVNIVGLPSIRYQNRFLRVPNAIAATTSVLGLIRAKPWNAQRLPR